MCVRVDVYVFSVYKYSGGNRILNTHTHEYITHYCRPDKFCMCFFRCLIQLIGLGFVRKNSFVSCFPPRCHRRRHRCRYRVISPNSCMHVCVCASPSLSRHVYVSARIDGGVRGRTQMTKTTASEPHFPFYFPLRTRKHIDLFISFRRFSIWEFESPLCA